MFKKMLKNKQFLSLKDIFLSWFEISPTVIILVSLLSISVIFFTCLSYFNFTEDFFKITIISCFFVFCFILYRILYYYYLYLKFDKKVINYIDTYIIDGLVEDDTIINLFKFSIEKNNYSSFKDNNYELTFKLEDVSFELKIGAFSSKVTCCYHNQKVDNIKILNKQAKKIMILHRMQEKEAKKRNDYDEKNKLKKEIQHSQANKNYITKKLDLD